MLSTEKDEAEEVDDLNNSTDDRMYARLASLEVDRSILLEAFLISNWGNREVLRLPANAETVKDIDFARVDVPKMMNSCENGIPFDLSMCGSSFYGAGLPLKESRGGGEKDVPFSSKGNEQEEGEMEEPKTTTTATKPPPPEKRGTESTSWNAKNGNDQQNNGIRRDDVGNDVARDDEGNNNDDDDDDSTAENIQQLRETIQKEYENKADSQEEQKLDDSPLVKSMRELGVGSPAATASPKVGGEDADEGEFPREQKSKENQQPEQASTSRTSTDKSSNKEKFQIMELLLKSALDDIVEPTFSAFSESDFAELALEVWLCRTPSWSNDAISEVIKALDIDEAVGKTIANIATKCQGYAPMEPEQSARTHLMSMSLGNVHRATDILCPEIDFFTSRSIAISRAGAG